MGRVIVNGPEDCGHKRGWCVICLAEAKQTQWLLTKDDQEAGLKKPGDELTVIPWMPALYKEMFPGLYRGVSGSAPQLGVVDGLCWNHMAGIAPAHRSSLVDGDGKAAGLMLGRG